MLIFPTHRKIIITPPKNASSTLHMTFGPRNNVIWVNGPVFDTWTLTQHCTCVHHGYHDFQIFTVVRNPLARLASLYRHCVQYNWPDVPRGSFKEFLESWEEKKHYHIWFLRNQSWYHDHIDCDGVLLQSDILKMEELDKRIHEIVPTFGQELPRIHRTSYEQSWQELFTDECFDLAYGIVANEFERYGYLPTVR